MEKRKIAMLVILPACIFLVFTATAILVMSAGTASLNQPEPVYFLRAWEDHVGLFSENAKAPMAQYDVYLALLPAQDVERLRMGIRAGNRAQAMRLLEDLGY